MEGIFVDNGSFSLMINENFKALSLIYKGAGSASSIRMQYSEGNTNTTAVTVTSSTPPIFFGLAYNNGVSIFVSPILTQVSGNTYTTHYLRHAGAEFYVFSADVPVAKESYGIEVRGTSGELLFTSSVKPLKIIAAGNVRTTRGTRDFNIGQDIAGKKIAIAYCPNEYLFYSGGNTNSDVFIPTLRIINNKQVYFEQFKVFNTPPRVDPGPMLNYYGNGTDFKEQTYLVVADVTNL